MTSKKVILNHHHYLYIGLALACFCFTGCSLFKSEKIIQPHVYPSPYAEPVIWAVVPFANESGTSTADSYRFAEQYAQQLEQVEGFSVISLNRSLEAMKQLELIRVATLADANSLMQALNVDGLIVGTITAYDPYDPPKCGAAIQLFLRKSITANKINPRDITHAPTENHLPTTAYQNMKPASQFSGYFDAANGSVIKRLRDYAVGRIPDDSPSGWRRYILSMDLYTEFVSHELMRRLFAAEWSRLRKTKTDAITSNPQPNSNISP